MEPCPCTEFELVVKPGQGLSGGLRRPGPPPDDTVVCTSAVVAPDWLPQMAAPQQEALFDAWFLRVPASAALLALTSCAPAPPGIPQTHAINPKPSPRAPRHRRGAPLGSCTHIVC
jgi:hypothetical protein